MKTLIVVAAASCGLGLPLPRSTLGQGAAAAAVADTSPFHALDLPAPNAYRSGSGRPGPSYGQQRVSYAIRAM